MDSYSQILDRSRRHFASAVTRTYEWRVDQLERLARMIAENEADLQAAMAADFKTASQEQIFETQACLGEIMFQKSQLREWMTPVEMPVPKPLAATGHKALVYRDPYGVALLIGPFNGPLLLLFRPAAPVLAAGNCCVLKLSERLMATSELLTKLIPAYFEPEAVIALRGGREEMTEILRLQFDFIFFTGSTHVGKIVARAAAENLTPDVAIEHLLPPFTNEKNSELRMWFDY
jgi:aldehyde dehydrogenase (NAD+)